MEKENKDYYTPGGWNNILFSFLTTLSTAMMISWLTGNIEPEIHVAFAVFSLSVFSGIIYFYRTIRINTISKADFKYSILIDIIIFLLYMGIAPFAIFIKSAFLILLASTTGLLFLIINDTLITKFQGWNKSSLFHGGQAFITALLIASFLTGMKMPFLFIAVIKLISSTYIILATKPQNIYLSLWILRILLSLVAGVTIFCKLLYSDPVIICLFLSGELLDRVFFYRDLNILQTESDK